jgi:hypothetical protein
LLGAHMPSRADSPSSSDPKLPRVKARRRTSGQNEWFAADRAERRRQILVLLVLGAILCAAIALIVAGLRS